MKGSSSLPIKQEASKTQYYYNKGSGSHQKAQLIFISPPHSHLAQIQLIIEIPYSYLILKF